MHRPSLDRGVLVAAFRGWNDGGQGASLAAGYLASRRHRSPRLFALGLCVLAVLLVQMGLGELQWRTHLPWGLVLVHVTIAACVFAWTVGLVARLWRPPATGR